MTIIAINFVLKTTIIYLVDWIGYETHSEVMTRTANAVFFAYFFNTGILPLLTNANMTDVSNWLDNYIHGTYHDYST